jgi:hypothetical protein
MPPDELPPPPDEPLHTDDLDGAADGMDGADDDADPGGGIDPWEDDDDLNGAGPAPVWPALGSLPPGLARPAPADGTPPAAGLLDVTLPWITLAGLAGRPGTLGRMGTITPAQARQLALAAASDPGLSGGSSSPAPLATPSLSRGSAVAPAGPQTRAVRPPATVLLDAGQPGGSRSRSARTPSLRWGRMALGLPEIRGRPEIRGHPEVPSRWTASSRLRCAPPNGRCNVP